MTTYTISFTDEDGQAHKLAQTEDATAATNMVTRFSLIYPRVTKSQS